MSPHLQRVSIAAALGWLEIKNYSTIRVDGLWLGYPPKNPIIGQPVELPDYLNDLNAMHEAEKSLKALLDEKEFSYGLWIEYAKALCRIVEDDQNERIMFSWKVFHSTAAQRAEAFLKTIGKWETSTDASSSKA
jgi:hypothetical protein